MSLRRCPACKNLVERESEICPICGRTYLAAMLMRVMPWMIALLLAVWTIHKLHPHKAM